MTSAGKRVIGAKRRKSCNRCQARENVQPVTSAGKVTVIQSGLHICSDWLVRARWMTSVMSQSASSENTKVRTVTAIGILVVSILLFCLFSAPHQPRLDWQIWFAALGSYEYNPWFVHLVYRLLQGQQDVLDLLAKNPFPHRAPIYIRARLYKYHYTELPKNISSLSDVVHNNRLVERNKSSWTTGFIAVKVIINNGSRGFCQADMANEYRRILYWCATKFSKLTYKNVFQSLRRIWTEGN